MPRGWANRTRVRREPFSTASCETRIVRKPNDFWNLGKIKAALPRKSFDMEEPSNAGQMRAALAVAKRIRPARWARALITACTFDVTSTQ